MKKVIKIAGILFVLLLCAAYFLPAVQSYSHIPGEIYILKGSSKTIDLGLPVKADVDSSGVVNISGETLEKGALMQSPLVIKPLNYGKATIELSIFGIPVKTVRVNVTESLTVIPGGQSIGVALDTRGALVVGITGVQVSDGKVENPAREAGMLPGDVIIRANGIEIQNAKQLMKIINETQGTLALKLDRNGRTIDIFVNPVHDPSDGKMRLGVWVRDNTAGVGTLTFIIPDTRQYGGLGHAITDLDTGSVLSVREGEIYFSEVIQINKGESGIPGEIKGFFSNSSGHMGNIEKNTEFGIYGKVFDDVDLSAFGEPIQVASRDEIKTGPAQILSTVDNEGVKAFSCQILRLNDQREPEQKGIVLQITDKELLEKTGGIIQGMSGSPIIQNGKLVGAVTHVFVNDPSKGYGLYADFMLGMLD